MAAVITDVQPRTFRSGDSVTVTGSGFAPTFGDNRVNVNLGTPGTILSESDTVIVFEVPAGLPTNQQVEVIVSRVDTQEASLPFVCWSLASAAEARDFGAIMPGQVPGPREAAHLDVDVQDVGQARDYERVAAHALRIADEILTQQGDIFTSDGTNPERLPVGGGGMELHTRTAEALDLRWEGSTRWLTFRWGAEISSGAAMNLRANGDAFATVSSGTEHGIPFDGELNRVGVIVHMVGAGDTLDQVRVLVNGGSVHDSGAGLALGAGASYIASFTSAINAGDLVQVECTAAGPGNPVNVTASVRAEETTNIATADTVIAEDSVEVVKTGAHDRSASDSVSVVDDLVTELTR